MTREFLRQQTSKLHQKLDAHPLVCELIASNPDPRKVNFVADAFQKMWASYSTLFEHDPLCGSVPYFSEREHLRSLSNKTATNSAVYSSFYLLGAFYTREGSSLGGVQVFNNLCGNKLISDEVKHFFYPYGERTSLYWKSFCNFLDSLNPSREELRQMEKGAKAPFRKAYSLIKSRPFHPS